MNTAQYMPEPLATLGRFLREELAEHRPGRLAQSMQLGGLCLLTTLLSMTFHVPLLAVSLIVLFYGVQPNSLVTGVVVVVFFVATAIDVGALFVILKYAYGYPLLRITAASLILLGSMYLMRVNKLGLVFFAVALVVIYGQTIPDSLDFPEVAVRALMWAIIAGLYPVVLMFIVCCCLFPSRPLPQLQHEMHRQLGELQDRLQSLSGVAGQLPALPPQVLEKDALALQKLHTFACGDNPGYRQMQSFWLACIAAVSSMRGTLNNLSAPLPQGPAQALLSQISKETAALDTAIAQASPYRNNRVFTESEKQVAGQYGLDGVCHTLQALTHFDLNQPTPEKRKERLFVADALTNPVYLRFALKVVLACLICYVFYHGVAWDGIHTSLLTCVIVATPSTGASKQKMVLRFGGAVVGMLLALFMAIVIMPRLDGIFGLLLALTPVFFTGAWVATGSERSSYIGTQFVFTFALAMLEKFGPVTDLTEIRDRAIGILVGILVSAVVYTLIWPEREADQLRQKLAMAVRQVSKLVGLATSADAANPVPRLSQRLACQAAFVTCEEMRERVAQETLHPTPAGQCALNNAAVLLQQLRLVVNATDQIQNPPGNHSAAMQTWSSAAVAALEHYADELETGFARPPILSTPLAALQTLARHIAHLPDWTRFVADTVVVPATKAS